MANRTTFAAVALIIEVDSTISADLAPFIEVANDLVTDVCTDSEYTEAKLELIERWLSAHFYAIRDARAKAEKADVVSQAFFGKVGLNLDVTRYGQMAKLIDSAGNLGALDARIKKGMKTVTSPLIWLGTGDSFGNDDTADEAL